MTARSFVLLHDRKLIAGDRLPKSTLDLAGPGWKGRSAYNPRAAAFRLVIAVEKQEGAAAAKAWLAGLAENGKA